MKFKLTINHLIFGLLSLVILIGIFKVNLTGSKDERKQEISATGVSTKNIKEIKIISKQFYFSPNPINLKLNEKVRLKITSLDVIHGFFVPELGMDQIIEPGKETVIDFQPTRKGTFALFCSIACGTGHSGMKGSIIIE